MTEKHCWCLDAVASTSAASLIQMWTLSPVIHQLRKNQKLKHKSRTDYQYEGVLGTSLNKHFSYSFLYKFPPFVLWWGIQGTFYLVYFKLEKPELTLVSWTVLYVLNSCQIQVRLGLFFELPWLQKRWVQVQIHAGDSFYLGFWGELKPLSLIFAEDPAVLIIIPVAGKAAVMCQHTEFQRGWGEPSLLLTAPVKITWPQGMYPAGLGENEQSHQLLTWGCQAHHCTSV